MLLVLSYIPAHCSQNCEWATPKCEYYLQAEENESHIKRYKPKSAMDEHGFRLNYSHFHSNKEIPNLSIKLKLPDF